MLIILTLACSNAVREDNLEQCKQEILDTEAAFAELASKEGIPIAFSTFAAEDAVLNRNNSLIIGKTAIKKYLGNTFLENIKLEWKPDFVDVSSSGDLGYTYGYYTFSAFDSSGNRVTDKGVFHTVWKKQDNGQWRYVWD